MKEFNHIFLDKINKEKTENSDFRLQYILNIWPQIVGYNISQYSFIKSFENGILTVVVNNSPFMHEIKIQSPIILKKMNTLYGEEIFKKIRCMNGSMDKKEKREKGLTKSREDIFKQEPVEYVPLDQIVLPKNIVDNIDESLHHIENPELRDMLRKTSIALKKKKFYLEEEGYWTCQVCGSRWTRREKTCATCEEKRYIKKIHLIKNIIIEKPHIDIDEINEHIHCTMTEMNEGRLAAVRMYAERMKCEDPSMDDRYKLVMILQHKEKEELNDAYVLKVTDKYLPYEYRKWN